MLYYSSGKAQVVFYQDGPDCPVLDWLDGLPERAQAKGIVRIRRLSTLGHELRRPEADYLRDGIHELRWRLGSVNYRILYFFHAREAIVLAHGMTKEGAIPDRDIDWALQRKSAYIEDPQGHTHYEDL